MLDKRLLDADSYQANCSCVDDITQVISGHEKHVMGALTATKTWPKPIK